LKFFWGIIWMSKAFTKEDGAEPIELKASGPKLPPGAKNYMTPAGAVRVRDELSRLLSLPVTIQKQEELRILYLQERLNDLVVVDPLQQSFESVRFGATVTLNNDKGETKTYQIVGIDEADPLKGRVSWISPLARALLGSEAGDVVTLNNPRGKEELEIIQVSYKEIV
jgi:transcription elongation factor GreB